VNSLRLAFAGTPDFAARHLEALLDSGHAVIAVLTQPDRRAGRGKKATASPVKQCALDRGLHVLQPRTLRDPDIQQQLRELELDALVVVAYGLILPEPVLQAPRFGCINVHGSLLPRWRGAAPIQRAIEAGDSESGITIMQMDAGLDTGPMLACRRCPIPPLATSGDLYALLADLGPDLLCEVLGDLPGHLNRAKKQNDAEATYAHKIDKSEAQIDWSQAAPVLARRLRAFSPAPGAYSVLSGQRIKIWEGQPQPAPGGTPGTILDTDKGQVLVACGDGALALTKLQLPGSRAMSADEILRGRRDLFAAGARFELLPG
jgi:methionyl-tRNA formyltransferase